MSDTPMTDAMWSAGKGDTTYQRSLYDFSCRLERDRADLLKALRLAEGDINWMLNNRQFLSGEVFSYLYTTLEKFKDET